MRRISPRRLGLLAGAALLLVLPHALPAYYLVLACSALALAIACLGLNLLLGTTGLLSLGHAAYFGLGAYAGGFLYTFLDIQSLEVFLLAGVATAGAVAALLGGLCVQATRIHFTILTLASAQIVHALFMAGIVFRAAGGVGRGLFLLGGGGLYIPLLSVAGRRPPPEAALPLLYYVTALAFAGSAGLLWRIRRSPFGMALQAARDNPTRALMLGIPVRRYRWYAFTLSGCFTGLAGGLTGQLDRQVTPEQLYWIFSAKLVLATVLGGFGYFLGPAAGAIVLVALQEAALRLTEHWSLVLGALLILITWAAPGGLLGLGARLLGHAPAPEPRWDGRPPPGRHG
jgi:branched-chain amino acid transport system permease protein